MTFSARSLSLLASSWRSFQSPASVVPRGRVPLIGLVRTTPSGDTARNCSGDALRSEILDAFLAEQIEDAGGPAAIEGRDGAPDER